MTRQIAEQLFTSPSDQGNSTFERSGARIGRRCWGRWFSVLIVALTLSPLAFAAPPDGKGKGGGGGGGGEDPPPPPPMPVQYVGVWLDEGGWPNSWGIDPDIRARDMNNSFVVVGTANQSNAFCYVGGVLMDLNELSGTWVDVDGEPLEGWTAVTAQDVNELGQIVGTAQHSSAYSRVYVLEFPEDSVPKFTLLPSIGDGDNRGIAINDDAVVVGDDSDYNAVVYTPWSNYVPVALGMPLDTVSRINNVGEITGRQGYYMASNGDYPNYTYTPGAFIQFANRWFYNINEDGLIVGSRDSLGKGKNKEPGASILIDPDPDGTEVDLMPGSLFDIARAINNAGHVGFINGNKGFVWRTDVEGALALNDLVVNAEEFWGDGSLAMPIAIAEPDNTGFGHICGTFGSISYRSFILVPQDAQAE